MGVTQVFKGVVRNPLHINGQPKPSVTVQGSSNGGLTLSSIYQAAVTAIGDARAQSGSLLFTFDADTTDGDPGAGKLRLNNADLTFVTAAYVDNADADGNDVSAVLDLLDDSTSVLNKATLYLREGPTGKMAVYRVTASVVDATGYRKLTLAYAGASAGGLTAGNRIGLSFAIAGDKASAAGADKQVQFRDGTEFAGDSRFTWDKAAGSLVLQDSAITFADVNGTMDTMLRRGGAGILEQYNGANAQAFRVYNTFTDASNYERGTLLWSANGFHVITESAGTGVARPMIVGTNSAEVLNLRTNGSNRWQIDTSGHLKAALDNVYDIGATAAGRPRHLYLGGNLTVGTRFVVDATNANFDLNLIFNTDNARDIGTPSSFRPRTGYFGTSVSVGSKAVLGLDSGSGQLNLTRALDGFGWAISPDGSNTLVFKSGSGATLARRGEWTDSGSFRLYNAYTDASNYERGGMRFVGPTLEIFAEWAGTGLSKNIGVLTPAGSGSVFLGTNGAYRWQVNTGGHLVAFADNSYDIGAAASGRPRNGYFGTSFSVGQDLVVNAAGSAGAGTGIREIIVKGPAGDNSYGGAVYLQSRDGATVTAQIIASTAGLDLSFAGVARGTFNANGLAVAGAVKTGSFTVATLPSAATVGDGARAIVTDATQTFTSANIGSAPTGGGANKVPVIAFGGAWVIG